MSNSLDQLPPELLFRIVRHFLDPKSRIQLRQVNRYFNQTVASSYPKNTRVVHNADMDIIACSTPDRRAPWHDRPGKVRLFYVYHPDVFCMDMLEMALLPDRICHIEVGQLRALTKKVKSRICWTRHRDHRKILERLHRALMETKSVMGFQRAAHVFYELGGSFEIRDQLLRREMELTALSNATFGV